MNINLENILTYFLSTSVVTAGIVYLAKKAIDKYSDSILEKYKTNLQFEAARYKQQLDLDMETFRSGLNIKSAEHQIRYTKLYEQRGEVIKLLYLDLLDLEKAMENVTTLFQGPEWTKDDSRDEAARIFIKKVIDDMESNRLYFSDHLCNKILQITVDCRKILGEMFTARRVSDMERNNGNTEGLESSLQTWLKADEKVNNEIKAARLDLATEFRTLIGVL